ncbi:MAG: hypothetical protein KIT18_07300 [Burkholderiales bacterium]|nr:hypothetical protein [Burkholderiales bacterium]
MFKIQIDEENNGLWRNVTGTDGKLLVFEKEAEARARLAEMFPVLVKMEQYAGPKRTRVVAILEDEDDWPQRSKKPE